LVTIISIAHPNTDRPSPLARDSLGSSADKLCLRSWRRVVALAHAKRPRTACSGTSQSSRTVFVGKPMPGQPRRLPGLLANLQAARAAIFFIEHDDNHSDILGETAREIKLWS